MTEAMSWITAIRAITIVTTAMTTDVMIIATIAATTIAIIGTIVVTVMTTVAR